MADSFRGIAVMHFFVGRFGFAFLNRGLTFFWEGYIYIVEKIGIYYLSKVMLCSSCYCFLTNEARLNLENLFFTFSWEFVSMGMKSFY